MKLKQLNILVFLFITTIISAQQINQFDANGKRNGVWKKNFIDTKEVRYEGEFKNGKEIGLFKFYKYVKKKSVLSATKQFNATNNIAEVTFFASNGNIISQGKMDGKKHIGTWEYFHKNSKQLLRLEEFDNNGLQQGALLVYYKDGTVAEKSIYKDGKLNGKSLWYNEKEVVVKEFTYVNDELNGPSKYFTNTGVLIIEGQYKNAKKHGVWKYYEDGKLTKEKNFTYVSKNPYKN